MVFEWLQDDGPRMMVTDQFQWSPDLPEDTFVPEIPEGFVLVENNWQAGDKLIGKSEMNKAAAKERSDWVESPEGFINAHPDEIQGVKKQG